MDERDDGTGRITSFFLSTEGLWGGVQDYIRKT